MSASQSQWPAPAPHAVPVAPLDAPAPGARLRLAPGRMDLTVNLHDRIVCMRRSRVADLRPITARSAMC